MANVGDFCWRDSRGVAHLVLPHRVHLPDGTTRTDAEQWSADEYVTSITGWTRSTMTQADIDRLFPPPPPPSPLDAGYDTGLGFRLGWQAADVALLTGLYVLARRAAELGISQPIVIADMNGVSHSLTLAQYEQVMLGYGAARAALITPPVVIPQPQPQPQVSNHT
jgi:hypothetical protein